jgi:PIN domain nuclease of toxin-antitoxin system
MLLLDTCALVWWTLDPAQLSRKAAEACSRTSQAGAVVSSISFWELGVKIKKGKLELGLTLAEYISRVKRLNAITIVPVDEDLWLANLSLKWDHADPVDRTIVATAMRKGLAIVTKDEVIRKFYRKVIW